MKIWIYDKYVYFIFCTFGVQYGSLRLNSRKHEWNVCKWPCKKCITKNSNISMLYYIFFWNKKPHYKCIRIRKVQIYNNLFKKILIKRMIWYVSLVRWFELIKVDISMYLSYENLILHWRSHKCEVLLLMPAECKYASNCRGVFMLTLAPHITQFCLTQSSTGLTQIPLPNTILSLAH